MAKYLITSGTEVMDVVKAKSIREAVEGMKVEGDAEFVVYTVTSRRTVKFETVKETRLSVVTPSDTEKETVEEDESE